MSARNLVRRWSLGAALVATVAAAAWMPPGEDRPREPARRAGAGYEAVTRLAQAPPAGLDAIPDNDIELDRLRRREAGHDFGEMFQVRNWLPPAPPAPKLPPQRPRAPELPFVYMGRMIEKGKVTLFLAEGERSIVVHKGETVDGRYRIEDIASNAVSIIYLPLRERQVLRIESID